LQLARTTEVRGLRTRVVGDLARGRRDRAARQQLALGRAAADADGQVGRADAASRALGEEALDAPVLERVERDRAQDAAGRQHLPRARKAVVDLLQLGVDGDPDRLEGALGRVAAAELRGDRDRGLDHLDERLRRLDRRLLAGADDRAGDLAGVALLP